MMHEQLQQQLQQLQLTPDLPPIDADQWRLLLNRINQDYQRQHQRYQEMEQSQCQTAQAVEELNRQLHHAIENKLIIERTRFISVLSALGDGLCTFDETGQLFFSNPAAQHCLAYPQHCLEVWQHFQLHHPGNEQVFITPTDLLSHILKGRSYRDDEAMLVSNGQSIPVSCIANPFFDSHSISGFVFVFREVSEQRKIKNDLYKAYQLAQESNTSKSQFLANMSHEIRTPMNGVIGISELLLKTPLNQEQKYYAKIIQDSSHALLHIINDILDLSKIEAGNIELESIPFNLYDDLEKLGELFSVQAEQKSLDLVLYCDTPIPFQLQGDPARIRQVLFNLLGNALKFTEQGEISLKVSHEVVSEDSVVLQFSLTDTGIGIPKAAQAKLFSRFTQVDASTTRRYGGSGLGLSISKFLVELMGGEIGFDSAPGEGSTFWFKIPLKLTAQASVKPRFAPLFCREPLHALVLETHDLSRLAIVNPLKTLGINCHSVVNLADAIAFLQQNPDHCQVFITSWDVEEMEQSGLIAALAHHHTALILTTYPSLHANWEHADHYGLAFTYLNKPIFLRKLQQALQQVLAIAEPDTALPTAIPVTLAQSIAILVVEDDDINQLVVTTFLEKKGYRVEVANHGLEALQKLQNPAYQLVFMDCQMPHLDGFQTTQQYREHEQQTGLPHLPIIGLTAYAMMGDREKCLAAGMDDYMTKPIDFELMETLLTRWVG